MEIIINICIYVGTYNKIEIRLILQQDRLCRNSYNKTEDKEMVSTYYSFSESK